MPGMFDLIQCTRSKAMSLMKGLSPSEKKKSFMGYMRPFCLVLLGFLKKSLYCAIQQNRINETQHSKGSEEKLYKCLSLAVNSGLLHFVYQ